MKKAHSFEHFTDNLLASCYLFEGVTVVKATYRAFKSFIFTCLGLNSSLL